MNAEQERTRSIWMGQAPRRRFPGLTSDEEADVAVIGAGIAGLAAAYELSRAGKAVVVIDRGKAGRGMTGRTTAHLASELDDFYHELIRLRGRDAAAAYYRGQAAAIDWIEAVARTEGIDCDFHRLAGYLFLADGDDVSTLDEERAACSAIGFLGVEKVDRAPVPGVDTGPALRFPLQGRMHMLKFVDGLVEALHRDGARFYEETAATSIAEANGTVTIETEGGSRIRAAAAVVATNSPIIGRLAIHAKQAPYRTYAVALEVASGAVEDALVWDTGDPYHYVRLQELAPGRMALIVGGEDHKTGEADDGDRRLGALLAWARRHYPAAAAELARWSGQVMEPADFLPYTGLHPEHEAVYVHTGDSGQGITNGVMGATVIRDLCLGRETPLQALLDPKRSAARKLGALVSESLTVAKNFAERVTGGEISSEDELAAGEGGILRRGLSKLAVYRAESGALTYLSATCTHAGCIVHWNPLERCWDCPCHGSQFAPDGPVLNAPAVAALKRAD